MTINVTKGADIHAISALSGLTILENLRTAGLSEPETPCGGRGKCRKCAVIVTGHVLSVDTGEDLNAQSEPLLACRWLPLGELTVCIPDSSDMQIIGGSGTQLPGGGAGLGAAFDIGTTTVAGFLYDLESGRLLSCLGERNSQRGYGADVISRICAASEGGLKELSHCIRNQLFDMQQKLAKDAGRNAEEIKLLSVAGNTVMEHIFYGLSPESIGVAPFKPLSLFGQTLQNGEAFDGVNAGGLERLYLCPCVAGYVGGDITAGLMATASDEADGLRLFIDIGTNGEMALGNKDGYVCCATAAGPAFEGAQISCGMSGTKGAIDRVYLENGALRLHVIGDAEPAGICGSGLIDAVAVFLDLGVITEAGRLVTPEEAPESLRDRIFTASDGHRAIRLADDVYLHAQDIREVQLAKAAIRAGAETLLQRMNRSAADITELVIAGGFGSFMDKHSALRIGLLPQIPAGCIRHAGNAAGSGASMVLVEGARVRLAAMTAKCKYLELSSSPEFMENYMEYMAFDD